jgi:activator of HSP90 ATPase
METKTIKQSATFDASPHTVYEMLMDSKKHSVLMGDEAKISRKIGGKFNVGSYIEGVNLELVPDQKIVQTWRYEDWPKGHFSRATFSLKARDGKTRLTFTQSDVPVKFYEDIKQGWIDYYWTPMKEMLMK